jgi:molybdopterin molybdotransferase
MLVTAVHEAGAIAYRVGPIMDEEEAFLAAIEDHVHRADLFITSGGVSMGAYDTVKAVLEHSGHGRLHQGGHAPWHAAGSRSCGERRVPDHHPAR